MGGIGKTQIAVEYAYCYEQEYDAVFWIRADAHDLLVSDFCLLADILRLPERNATDQNITVRSVLRWLEMNQRWLLIFDNVTDLVMVRSFIPANASGHILLTTRATNVGTLAQRIELDTMVTEEGTLFLLRRVKKLGEVTTLEGVDATVRKDAQAIVETLGGLPLALDQAGAYIEETECSLSDYLKLYHSHSKRLLRTRGKDATGHPEPVATTWSLSIENVRQSNPAAIELLYLCAFLHSDDISITMLAEGSTELGPALQSVIEDGLDFDAVIAILRKYSLIFYNTNEQVLSIHRLVQAMLQNSMDVNRQGLWAERAVRLVNKTFPEVTFSSWSLCQQYLPQAQSCADSIEQRKMKFPEAAQLLYKTGMYLYERGQYVQVEQLLQRSLLIREQLYGLSHEDVAQSLNSLATLYTVQGKYEEAEQLLQRTLLIDEQVYGAIHSNTARSFNNLALLYEMRGKYEQAEEVFHRALHIWEQLTEPEPEDVAANLNNLGTLYRKQAKYVQAEEALQRAYRIREQALGTQHPDVANSLNNRAGVYAAQGKYIDAIEFVQRAMNIYEQALGPMHPQMAGSLNNLGALYQELGRYEEAEAVLQRALQIREQAYGVEHSEVALTLHNIAQLLHKQKKYQEAEAFYQRTLQVRIKTHGAADIEVAVTLLHLAQLYHEQNQYKEAESFYQRALKIAEQELSSDNLSLIPYLKNYAALLRELGRKRKAASLEVRAKAILAAP